MKLGNKGPIFVPKQFFSEFDKLSKAALMDIAWDYAARCRGKELTDDGTMQEFRDTRDIILCHRKQS